MAKKEKSGTQAAQDTTQANLTGDTPTAKAKRERQFGRVYDHTAGTARITAAFAKDFGLDVALASIPQPVLSSFALMAACDFISNEMNDALKAEKDSNDQPLTTEDERRAYSLIVGQEAYAELVKGELDFRSGTGLGGMRSTIGVMAQALFDLGKKFVRNSKGETLEFSDIHGARDALKALYNDTTPQGERKITSRMIFNAIQADPSVAGKIAELRKGREKVSVENVMG